MEAVISSAEFKDPPNNGTCGVTSSSASAVFRNIEFHLARKQFNGFSNSGSDFKIETLNPSSGNKRTLSAPSVKKTDRSDLSEHGLDRELTFSITFRKIGAGLENLGNTCFLNSVLQCLTYTEPFAAYLQKAAHQKYCHVAGFCALCAMQKHVRNALQATGRILAPKDLVSNIRCISRNFRNCRQEDAHEYMINLLECIHKCCLPSGVPSESSDAYRKSLVHKIFGGSLRSQVKCEQCSHCSNKFEPFLDLSLDISKADSLQKALLRFTAVELLDDGAKVYQCERCKQKVKAKKQLTVSKAPYVLTIHLKRFEAHRSEKIDRKVQFAPAINMKPFVSGPNEGNLKYTLYGVLVHYGRSIHSGHYACFVRTSSGMWYSLDDNRVFQVSEKTVFDQKAYMLFYVRDRQNASLKSVVTVGKKETSKESLAATNRASLIISSNRKDQVNGSAVIKTSGLDAFAANGSAPLKSCDLALPAVSTQKDLNTKETLQKEILLPQANGKGASVKEASKDTSAIVPGKVSSTTLQVKALGQHSEEPATLIMSAKGNSDRKTLSTKRKTCKHNMKNLQGGISSFKLTLGGVCKNKKQKRRRSSTLVAKIISEELISKKRATDHKDCTSQITSEVAFGSGCLQGKENIVSSHSKRIRSSNGNILIGGSSTAELKERTNQNGAVLASDQPHLSRSSDLYEASQNVKRKRGSSKVEQISVQKEPVTILTRGLPETVVPKWDEDVSVSEKIETSEARKIGYVADEWDEEYDRGKMKKIRIKEESYGGPNPFQLIASKKQTETKKKWTHTSKTAYRI